MDLSWRHDRWFRRLPSSPRDAGRVERLVLRVPGRPGERETPAQVRITADGLVGDKWSADPQAPDGTQVSLINVHVARAVAGGDEGAGLIGDNLHVDLDLSEENLPVGTRLEAGSVVLEVSEVAHRPCRSFLARFGAINAQRVARATRTGKRGRGVLCRVVQPGEVRVGDPIRVER